MEVAVEGTNEKDGFRVAQANVANLAGINGCEANSFEGVPRRIAQELLDRSKFTDLGKTTDRVILEPDDDLVGGGGFRGFDGSQAAPGGDRSYCLIL